jgi:NAD(P)-dependent dehydrogenase (short-subunit alcohol dehydrogenase family)
MASRLDSSSSVGPVIFNEKYLLQYRQSKLANLAYAAELARRYPQITSVSIHPGFVDTGMVRNSTKLAKVYMYGRHWLRGESTLSVEKGCLNTLWAAVGAKSEEVKNGAYYTPVGVLGGLDEVAKSEKFAEKLWSWTEKTLDAA